MQFQFHTQFRTHFRTLTAAMALTGLTSVTTNVLAQNTYEPDWFIMPYVSALNPDGNYGITGGGRQYGYGGGLRLGKTFADDFEVQLNLGHARKKFSGTTNQYKQTLADIDVAYFFMRQEWQPFVSLGIGGENDQRTLAGTSTSKKSVSANAGAGIRYMFNNDLGLQLEYRRVQGFLRNSTAFGFNNSGNNYVNLGLLWAFGAAPKPSPVPPKVVAPPPPPEPIVVVQAPPPPVVIPPPPPPAPPARVTLDASRLFELNSARVAGDIPELNAYAEALKANPSIAKVMVTGHTDQLGSASYNARLSQARANAVKAYLVRKGVDARRLDAKGMASTRLVTQCTGARPEMITCGQPNRRVELEQISVPSK